MALNPADQWPSTTISKPAGAMIRISFDLPKRRRPFWHYCHTMLVSTQQHNQLYTAQQNLPILAPLGLLLNDTPVWTGYSEADWATNRALLPREFRESYIIIQPTSRWFFRCWREDHMSVLTNALFAEGYVVVLTFSPDDREKRTVDTIITGYPQARLRSLAGQLTLHQLTVVIDRIRLPIGVDSVPMHMVVALGTPLVALFGPSRLTFWRSWQAKGEMIWAGGFGPLPDPGDINTNTEEHYLDLISTNAVVVVAKKVLA